MNLSSSPKLGKGSLVDIDTASGAVLCTIALIDPITTAGQRTLLCDTTRVRFECRVNR